jgi:hypothetical protein
VKGTPPAYVEPAYKSPIVMRPKAMRWKPTEYQGVERKEIGIFPHRGLTVSGIRIAAGSTLELQPLAALRFLIAVGGGGELSGEELRRWSAVRLHADAACRLSATDQFDLVQIAVAPTG